jgi:hypothetical protein
MTNFEVYLLENGLGNIQNLNGDQFISGFQEIAPGPFGLHFLGELRLTSIKTSLMLHC